MYSVPLSLFFPVHFVSKIKDTDNTQKKEENFFNVYSLYAHASERACAYYVHVRTFVVTHLFGILVKGKQNQNQNMMLQRQRQRRR